MLRFNTLSKNITRKSWAISFMAVTLLMAVVVPYAAYAGDPVCDAANNINDPKNTNVDVDAGCEVRAPVNGNFKLEDDSDSLAIVASPLINGNIDATAGTFISVASTAALNGNIDAKTVSLIIDGTVLSNVNVDGDGDSIELGGGTIGGNVEVSGGADLKTIGATTIFGNVIVKDSGELDLSAGTTIFGNVIVESGSDACSIDGDTTIFGNVEDASGNCP